MPAKKKLTARKVRSAAGTGRAMNFTALVDSIRQVHAQCAAQANRAVNVSLTLRNWAIGWYVREYEQRGADRAKYGEALVDKLAETLKSKGLDDMASRTLRQCRQFYSIYPMIWQAVSAKSLPRLSPPSIWQTVSAKSPAVCDRTPIVETVSPQLGAPVDKLVNALSFSHLAELIAIDDPLKRAFYEVECIRGNWSVRTLKRQIATLYFERSGLSKDKKMARMVQHGIETAEPRLAIRDPYIFEFLGLRAKDAVAESDLEAALVENLREFLLELGHGFCLEAQQKSIVIGNTRGFVDLVFYHRILRCHVLVALPTKAELEKFITARRKEFAPDQPRVD